MSRVSTGFVSNVRDNLGKKMEGGPKEENEEKEIVTVWTHFLS